MSFTCLVFFFFKQKTAYEMRISDWSSDVCSSDLRTLVNSTSTGLSKVNFPGNDDSERPGWDGEIEADEATPWVPKGRSGWEFGVNQDPKGKADGDFAKSVKGVDRSEEHTSELQSLMRISYAVFCLKKKH